MTLEDNRRDSRSPFSELVDPIRQGAKQKRPAEKALLSCEGSLR